MSAGEAPEAAGDFLLDFDHADIAFDQIIVERYGELGEEGEHLGTPVAQAVEEVGGRRVFGTTGGDPILSWLCIIPISKSW